MGDILLWISIHAVCIGAHLGLVVAGVYSFVSCGMDTGHGQQGCGWDHTAVIIPWASFGVGNFIVAFNGWLLKDLLRLEQPSRNSTLKSHISNKQWRLVIGLVFNTLAAYADVALTSAARAKSAGLAQLKPVYPFAAVGAVALLVTLAVDVKRLFELQRKKKNDEVVFESVSSPQPESPLEEYHDV